MSTARRSLAALALALLLCAASQAQAAPTAQLRVARGPYYITVPIDLQIQVTGLDREPEPDCRAQSPDGASLKLVAVVPQVSTSMQIINGRVSRSETVTFVCQYRFVASAPGTYRLKPFEVVQGGTVVRSSPYALDIEAVPLDPSLRVRVALPRESVYVGQQLPVRIEWWLDAEIADRIRGYALQSPLFDDPDTFRFLEDSPPLRGEQSLELDTAQGQIALKAEVTRRKADGREYIVIAATRQLVPLRAGDFELSAATINVDEVTRWQRDLFGSRRPAGTRRLFGRDEPLRLQVEAPPVAGRPGSFGGAIGKGFTLDVATDRSVVQQGDPITLTLTVRGDGQFSTVGPPPLDDMLSPEHFRVSEGDPSGQLTEEGKIFQIPVRVVAEDVREIPEIEYSWFDPELGEFQTTTSRPIALSVRPAQIISAGDVVQGREASAPSGDRAGASDDARRQSSGAALASAGADLSIERRIDRLTSRRTGAVPAQIALYGSGVAALAGALVWRRRSARDPESLRLAALYRTQRRRLEAAANLEPAAALAEIAALMREFSAASPELRDEAVDRFVRECDEIVYAPAADSSSAVVDERLARARTLLDELAERVT